MALSDFREAEDEKWYLVARGSRQRCEPCEYRQKHEEGTAGQEGFLGSQTWGSISLPKAVAQVSTPLPPLEGASLVTAGARGKVTGTLLHLTPSEFSPPPAIFLKSAGETLDSSVKVPRAQDSYLLANYPAHKQL